MMLNVETYKIAVGTDRPTYHTYRFPVFDIHPDYEGLDFEDKFNKAFETLMDEIRRDRERDDPTVYGPITISKVFLT